MNLTKTGTAFSRRQAFATIGVLGDHADAAEDKARGIRRSRPGAILDNSTCLAPKEMLISLTSRLNE
jgi:hypothetical protein